MLGEPPRVEGFVLSGVEVVVAEGTKAVHEAWDTLPEDAVVILTPAAADALEDSEAPFRRLRVVMPS